MSISALYALLLSILNLSNATKNQKDAFSSFIQSYFSKLHNAIYYIYAANYLCTDNSLKLAMGAFAFVLLANSLMGMKILYMLYGKQSKSAIVTEKLI